MSGRKGDTIESGIVGENTYKEDSGSRREHKALYSGGYRSR